MPAAMGLPLKIRQSIENAFDRFLLELGFYRLFLSEIVKPDVRITQVDMEKQMILEALAVKIHANWEIFTGDLMVDCLSCDTTQYANSMGVEVPLHPSRDVCEFMLTGAGITSMGDIKKVRGKAKDLLDPEHNPFQEISNVDISKIDEFRLIRNCIAHQSRRAKRSVRNIYLRECKRDDFANPGDFLSTSVEMPGEADKVSMLGVYLNAFFNASEKMKAYLFPEKKPAST